MTDASMLSAATDSCSGFGLFREAKWEHTSPGLSNSPLSLSDSGAGFQLTRMQREIFANLKLHSVDLGQKT